MGALYDGFPLERSKRVLDRNGNTLSFEDIGEHYGRLGIFKIKTEFKGDTAIIFSGKAKLLYYSKCVYAFDDKLVISPLQNDYPVRILFGNKEDYYKTKTAWERELPETVLKRMLFCDDVKVSDKWRYEGRCPAIILIDAGVKEIPFTDSVAYFNYYNPPNGVFFGRLARDGRDLDISDLSFLVDASGSAHAKELSR